MFKGLQKTLINFGINVLLTNAFMALITNERTVVNFLVSALGNSVPPKALAAIPGDDEADKKAKLIMVSGFMLTGLIDYLVLNQDTIKAKLEQAIKA